MTTTISPAHTTGAGIRTPAATGAATSPTDRLMRSAAIVGPIALGAASVAWLAGDDHAELRGILTFWAIPFLALAAYGLAGRLEGRSPVGRAVVTALIAIGACAGAGFATEINMVEHFGVERLMEQDTPSAFLALGIPGPMFPLGFVILGLLSFRHRTMPRAQALLLVAGGLLFPASRIPELPGLAIVADLLLLVALAPVAVSGRGGDGVGA
jgi:hypothetical protein